MSVVFSRRNTSAQFPTHLLKVNKDLYTLTDPKDILNFHKYKVRTGLYEMVEDLDPRIL